MPAQKLAMPFYVFPQSIPRTVTVSGTEYRFRIFEVIGSRVWRFHAEFGSKEQAWLLDEHANEARLMLALHSSGFEVPSKTVPHAILEQLVKEGRAQLVVARARPDLPPAA